MGTKNMSDYNRDNGRGQTQAKGAVALTIAAVILVSGVWAFWYEPAEGYDNRRNDQLLSDDFVLDAGKTVTKSFQLTASAQELALSANPQTIQDVSQTEEQPPQDIPPNFSFKLYDEQGNVIASRDNITYTDVSQRDKVDGKSGTFKIVLTNNDPVHSIRMPLLVFDVSKVPYHPLDALGQWLTVASMPIFGLSAWLIVSKWRQAQR
jgi:hypothetical protein